MLSIGARGAASKELQQMLADAGYDPGTIDGIFGAKTHKALTEFQKANGLTADGVYGPKTQAALSGGASTKAKKPTSPKGGDDFRSIVAEQFPSMLWALDHKELGPLLEEAADQEWTALKLQGRVQGSDWWKNSTATQRQLEVLKQTDPAQYEQRVNESRASIQTLAQDLGIGLTDAQVAAVAEQSMRLNLDQRALTQAIIGQSGVSDADLFSEAAEGNVGGGLSQAKAQLDRLNADYMLGLDEATLGGWMKGIISGEKTAASFEQYAKQMAMAQMPFLSTFIEQGLSPSQALQPYGAVVARTLEINPAEIDWKDARYQNVLRVQEKGGEQRLATTSEMQAKTREVFAEEYDRTSGAKQAATRMAGQIANMFGQRG